MLDNVRALWWRLAYELLGRQIPFYCLETTHIWLQDGAKVRCVYLHNCIYQNTPVALGAISSSPAVQIEPHYHQHFSPVSYCSECVRIEQ